jgi:Family of unknown function (DUF6325)
MAIGRVEYMVAALPENEFRGEIATALAELSGSGVIRIIDLVFVAKDSDGYVAVLEVRDLKDRMAEEFSSFRVEPGHLFNEDDLLAALEMLTPNSSAALLAWEDSLVLENLWGEKLAKVIREADWVILDHDRIPSEVVKAAVDSTDARATWGGAPMARMRQGPGLVRTGARKPVAPGAEPHGLMEVLEAEPRLLHS